MNASKAAGPLALWVKSIILYSEIFHSIEPLRKELIQLLDQESQMKAEKNNLDLKVIELESRIEELKIDYAHLVAKAENIKGDMKTVKEKVDRSI